MVKRKSDESVRKFSIHKILASAMPNAKILLPRSVFDALTRLLFRRKNSAKRKRIKWRVALQLRCVDVFTVLIVLVALPTSSKFQGQIEWQNKKKIHETNTGKFLLKPHLHGNWCSFLSFSYSFIHSFLLIKPRLRHVMEAEAFHATQNRE